MKTLIFPGYSTKNKDWAYEARRNIEGSHVYEWQHWLPSDTPAKFSVKTEVENIKKIIGEKEINILGKSIGTLIAAVLLKEMKFKKIILCGIPVNDLSEDDAHHYSVLGDIDPSQIVVFQNSDDEHGSFEEVRKFLSQINPNIKIVEKPGRTHDYPYFEDFKNFLNSGG